MRRTLAVAAIGLTATISDSGASGVDSVEEAMQVSRSITSQCLAKEGLEHTDPEFLESKVSRMQGAIVYLEEQKQRRVPAGFEIAYSVPKNTPVGIEPRRSADGTDQLQIVAGDGHPTARAVLSCAIGGSLSKLDP